MATATPGTPSLRSTSRNFAKPVLWAALALIALSVLFTVEIPLFQTPSPLRTKLLSERLILIPHALAGLTAFLIGPFQFSTRIRQRQLRLHRTLGKVYVAAVFISFPFAILLGLPQAPPIAFASDCQAVLWLLCTVAAFITARNRQITQHRIWMVRSYSITCLFFTERLLVPVPAYGNMGPVGIGLSIFFFQLWAFVLPDIAFHWQALTVRRK